MFKVELKKHTVTVYILKPTTFNIVFSVPNGVNWTVTVLSGRLIRSREEKDKSTVTGPVLAENLRASYLRFSGCLCETAAVGAIVSNTPLLVVTTPAGRPDTPGIRDAGPLLVNNTRPGGSTMPDDGGRTNIRRASDVTIKRCWASRACRCCSVRPAKFGITGRPATVYIQPMDYTSA